MPQERFYKTQTTIKTRQATTVAASLSVACSAVALSMAGGMMALAAIGVNGGEQIQPLGGGAGQAQILRQVEKEFLRGDSDGNGRVEITDSVFILNYLYQAGKAPTCMDAADANDNGRIDQADADYILSYLFKGGAAPPSPGPTTYGDDPTKDGIYCVDTTNQDDAKRITDMLNIQNGVERFFNANAIYPNSGQAAVALALGSLNDCSSLACSALSDGGITAGGSVLGRTYLNPIPTDPAGFIECSQLATLPCVYSYRTAALNTNTYCISFWLDDDVGNVDSGGVRITPDGFSQSACPF